jgi:glutamine---fructose-6-phosphate transaminase (isomerizing)
VKIDGHAGALMAAEMSEQPAVLARLIARADEISETLRAVAPRPLAGTAIVARGSSDHASLVGRYLLEVATGRPVSSVAPSLHTLYRVRADYGRQLVIAVSQSGRTPEIVEVQRRLRGAGAATLAITNDAGSPLAAASDAVIALGAGEERAVPATKTVTAQILAFALLARALGDVPIAEHDLASLPAAVARVLGDPLPARRVADALAERDRLVVTARGLLYGAALESALKLQETAGIAADGLSCADLRHGPIAIVDRGFPVIALSAPGPAQADVADLVATLRNRGADVVTISAEADADLPIPPVAEALAPVVAVVRAQQLAADLALLRGRDPDAPEGLRKVTAT